MKVNLSYSGVIKSQHLMLYWNLHHTPWRKVVFLIVAVLFVMQWCAQLFVSAKFAEILQRKKAMTTIPIRRIPIMMILMMIMGMTHTDWTVVWDHSFSMSVKFSVKMKVLNKIFKIVLLNKKFLLLLIVFVKQCLWSNEATHFVFFSWNFLDYLKLSWYV